MESATSVVADSDLSALFQGLFDKLALPSFKNLDQLFGGVEKEVEKLSSTLLRIQPLLSDAENRKIKDKSVRLWLSELKDVAYEAEDILDELEYRALQSKIKEEASQSKREEKASQSKREKKPSQSKTEEVELRSFISLIKRRKLNELLYSSPSDSKSNLGSPSDSNSNLGSPSDSMSNLGSLIKKVRERLEEIESENNHLHLKATRVRPPIGSDYIDDSVILGRGTDREKVVGLLLTSDDDDDDSSSSAGGNGIRVVPICGMGGLGKTTLAQLVYNDARVEKHFEVRAWVYVSQDFDLIRLSKTILESLTGSSPKTIQASTGETLKEKRFLLVLDDVWNENGNDWDALRAPLMSGARGSRILVTTRSQRVSAIVGTVRTHSLHGLSVDDCWSLFERRAFAEGNSDAHPDFAIIGKGIVNKCQGLPLAVKMLGGLLRSKVHVHEWEEILESELWELQEAKNDILPALIISFHHLPAHLKQCFAYCSIFCKGSHLEGDKLVLLWMAQGYIQSNGSLQMEDIGREYLADLVSRSLLNCDKYSQYTMHDLTHDLAGSVLGVEFLELGDEKSHKSVEMARHVSCHLSHTESFNFEDFYCSKSLRTLMLFGFTYHINIILANLFINFRHMRVLDLSGTQVTELPESIQNLIHLRYLDLSQTQIQRLPKSTTMLHNLQTLMLEDCYRLVEVPSDLSNLVNLRHLFLRGCSICIPPRIGRLTSLQTLPFFNVGKETGWRINELKDTIHLRGQLCILNLENVVDVQEAKEAELKKKQEIHTLELQWKSDDVDEGIEKEVLKGLQPCTNLKHLEIEGYCGSTFPRWLGDSSFSNLVSVDLYRCGCHCLPPFGQLPALISLSLDNLYRLKKVGREFYGDGTVKSFPSLKTLNFWSMPDFVKWSGREGDICHVSEISIRKCSKLMGLPLFPLTLERITIEQCERLTALPRVSTVRDLTLSGCDEQILGSLLYLTSLSFLSISKFRNLTSLPNGSLEPLMALKELKISNCARLMSLSEGLQHLTSLCILEISECPHLKSMGNKVLPTTLQSLKISKCSNLNCLPTELQNLTSLVDLTLEDCPKIHSLPEELPTTLRSLDISGCSLLEEHCLDGGKYWHMISHIRNIIIDGTRISSS